MTRAPYLAVFGGLIVLTVLLSLTRIVPTPEVDAKSQAAAVTSELGAGHLDLALESSQIKRKLVAFIGVQVSLGFPSTAPCITAQ